MNTNIKPFYIYTDRNSLYIKNINESAERLASNIYAYSANIDKDNNIHILAIDSIGRVIHFFNNDGVWKRKIIRKCFNSARNIKDMRLYILNDYFNVNIEKIEKCKVKENIFLDTDEEFIWPDLNNNIYNEVGTCYALRDHIGILVDGTIVPCCLDSNGVIKLGNIYKDNIDDIINSERYVNIINSFKDNKKCEELCKHCNFNKIRKGKN